MYGMESGYYNDSNYVETYAKEYKIPEEKSFSINSEYFSYIKNLDDSLWINQKNHLQPLQAMYFDNTGKLISYHINCTTGGFPNLKWNRDNRFETFPPKDVVTQDTILNYRKLANFIVPVNNNKYIPNYNVDYNVVVFWSIRMGRQSKRLIKLVQENAKLSSQEVNITYVNVDDIFLK